MQDSLWRSSIRSFLVTFFAVIAFFSVFIVVALFFSAIDTSEESITNNYTVEILPNAKGVRKKLSKDAPVVLEVNIQGVIGGSDLTQSTIEDLLVESRENQLKDDRVKAVLVHINSPGGTVTDADGIY